MPKSDNYRDSRARAKNKYNKKAYDTLLLRLTKGRKSELEQAINAIYPDGRSFNGFIVEAIDEKIERENKKGG